MTRFSGTTLAEKSFREWENDRREKRDQYWKSVFYMRSEYIAEYKGVYDLTTHPTIHYWAEQKYGFKMGIDGQGNYTQDYTVVDPKKFMLFQLKYWQ
jgi:hypothetical protein